MRADLTHTEVLGVVGLAIVVVAAVAAAGFAAAFYSSRD
jgi:hypothetical protein